MTELALDIKQALQIARAFNMAFNNAFMYGGTHQTTIESASSLCKVLQPILETTSVITVSAEKDSVFIENHCVDKLVSVQRINSRFKKAGVESVSFDRDFSLESVLALLYMMGALADFHTVDEMQAYLAREHIAGVRINYVVYQKVTRDDTVVHLNVSAEHQPSQGLQPIAGIGSPLQADLTGIIRAFSEMLSLRYSENQNGSAAAAGTDPPGGLPTDFGQFITAQIKAVNTAFAAADGSAAGAGLTSAEMLESIYTLKENILENIALQRATGKLNAVDELVISEINQLSYQVIVQLIREEFRSDCRISVKRLAQIIRRMLPDIKELKYLLPQLKEALLAEGMAPVDYLALVKELSVELDSDGLLQVMAEASEQVGLSLDELIAGMKGAPEEAARLIVLAAELRKGGVRTDDQQMSALLSDYIEKVSRSLALQAPETATPGGGRMLTEVVTRIERDIIGRLKLHNVGAQTVTEVAQTLADQFAATVATLKGDWTRRNINNSKNLTEETVLSIIEQLVEQGQEGDGVAREVRAALMAGGFSAAAIDTVVKDAKLRAVAAVTSKIEIPKGTYNASTMSFFINMEIKRNLRYNSPFSIVIVSFDTIVDLRTFSVMTITPDIYIQLTNQSLKLLKEMQRDLDVIGILTLKGATILLVVLPMTDLTGALYVKKRIERDFPCHDFMVDGLTVHMEPVIKTATFNKKLTADTAAFYEAVYKLYRQPKL